MHALQDAAESGEVQAEGVRYSRRVLSLIGGLSIAAFAACLTVAQVSAAFAYSVLGVICIVGAATHVVVARRARSDRDEDVSILAGRAAGAALPMSGALFVRGPFEAMVAQIVLALIVFQIVDALKPWPVFPLQRLARGGAVLGDLVAGGYALLAYHLLLILFRSTGAS